MIVERRKVPRTEPRTANKFYREREIRPFLEDRMNTAKKLAVAVEFIIVAAVMAACLVGFIEGW